MIRRRGEEQKKEEKEGKEKSDGVCVCTPSSLSVSLFFFSASLPPTIDYYL